MAADGKKSRRFGLTTDMRPAPFLIADARALDFLNSVATPVDGPVEWIESGGICCRPPPPASYLRPCVQAFRRAPLGELDAVAAQTRRCANGFALSVQKHRPPAAAGRAEGLEPLTVCSRDDAFGQIITRSWLSAGAVTIHVAIRETLALSRCLLPHDRHG
jgi:hypothetical protein